MHRPLPHLNPESREFREFIAELGWSIGVKAELLMLHASIADDEGAERDIRGLIDLVRVTAATFKDLQKQKENRFSPAPRDTVEERALNG